jgi:hypothetical protein
MAVRPDRPTYICGGLMSTRRARTTNYHSVSAALLHRALPARLLAHRHPGFRVGADVGVECTAAACA